MWSGGLLSLTGYTKVSIMPVVPAWKQMWLKTIQERKFPKQTQIVLEDRTGLTFHGWLLIKCLQLKSSSRFLHKFTLLLLRK
jgi:hypothetical protein